jgi:hypothetical protein
LVCEVGQGGVGSSRWRIAGLGGGFAEGSDEVG